MYLDRLAEKKEMHITIPETFYNTTGCGLFVNGVPRFAISTNSLQHNYTFVADVYEMSVITIPSRPSSGSSSAPPKSGPAKVETGTFALCKARQEFRTTTEMSIFQEKDQEVQVEHSAGFTWPVTYVPRLPHVALTRNHRGVIASYSIQADEDAAPMGMGKGKGKGMSEDRTRRRRGGGPAPPPPLSPTLHVC